MLAELYHSLGDPDGSQHSTFSSVRRSCMLGAKAFLFLINSSLEISFIISTMKEECCEMRMEDWRRTNPFGGEKISSITISKGKGSILDIEAMD